MYVLNDNNKYTDTAHRCALKNDEWYLVAHKLILKGLLYAHHHYH